MACALLSVSVTQCIRWLWGSTVNTVNYILPPLAGFPSGTFLIQLCHSNPHGKKPPTFCWASQGLDIGNICHGKTRNHPVEDGTFTRRCSSWRKPSRNYNNWWQKLFAQPVGRYGRVMSKYPGLYRHRGKESLCTMLYAIFNFVKVRLKIFMTCSHRK